MKKSVNVFAPATVANVAVGFDVLGFAFDLVGDRVRVERVDRPSVEIKAISGCVPNLPMQAELNTATVGLLKMRKDLGLKFGFDVYIEKGIPKGSGMGGSASSAVASVYAANLLLDKPLSQELLLEYALAGEAVASGAVHADNVAPCLFGALQLVQSVDPLRVIALPVPENLYCVLVHSDTQIETKEARKLLKKTLSLETHVKQSAYLASFVASCFKNDLSLMKSSLVDLIVEEQRAPLIPGFYEVQKAALEEGALACSISGSGPSMFALASSNLQASKIRKGMMHVLEDMKIKSESWVAPVSTLGAREIL